MRTSNAQRPTRDAGLITESDSDAKRAEILAKL